ncbi:MAG: LysE family translocator [Micromonosporaceae bacterium]|nr:LysE family translocator [Micromonosporaceae bacterium]
MLQALLAFAAFAAVLTITPGLDTMLVVRTAAVAGRRAGMAAGIGIGIGTLCWAAASALGITALLTASQLAYDGLRWAGATYLCYLAVRALVSTRKSTVDGAGAGVTRDGIKLDRPERGTPAPAHTPWRALRVGLTTNLLNPKVGVFYLSVLPQFLPRDGSPLVASMAMGLVHDVEGLVWFGLLVLVVGRVARVLVRPGVRRWLERVTAVVFLAFGVRLAVEAARN